jgi:hypothetical protein
MKSREVKLRRLWRLKQKKFRSRNPRLNAYLQLYWNYWQKCHGTHANLWSMDA